MKKFIINIVLKLLSLLPLKAIRGIGKLVGILSLKLSKRSSKRLRHNLLITGLASPANIDKMVKDTAQAMGMTLVEALLIAWQKNMKRIEQMCTVVDQASYDLVYNTLASGKKILFFTPHIGNFEIGLKYYTHRLPIDIKILYKPSKNKIINEIMLNGRTESNIYPEPTTRRGVMALMKHFQDGGDIGILPDNVASGGNGDWVKFFGQDVYATTLSAKIYQQHKPTTMIMRCIRTAKGFDIGFIPFTPSSDDTKTIMQELYHVIESMIREAPEQYYWSYDRFRTVQNAKPKPNQENQ